MKRTASKAEGHRVSASDVRRDNGGAGSGRAAGYEESKQAGVYGSDVYDGQDGGKSGEKVTVDMKMDLVAKVKKLSNEGLTKLVKHVQSVA